MVQGSACRELIDCRAKENLVSGPAFALDGNRRYPALWRGQSAKLGAVG